MRRYAGKVDTNHAAIRDGLRQIYGKDAVQDVSMFPGLGFDLIFRRHDDPPLFLEVKTREKRNRLEPSEIAAKERYGPFWRLVITIEDALA